MADICPLCNKRINRTGKNWTINGNIIVHKKCPRVKETLPEKEKEDYKKLVDRIQYFGSNRGKGYYTDHPINFKPIVVKIKQLKDKGYSYEEMLYALEEVVKLQDGFWGFGAVENRIDSIIINKKKKEAFKENFVEEDASVVIDLSKMWEVVDEDIEC